MDRINATNKALFINISHEEVKSVIVGWRESINKYKDKFSTGDMILANVYRLNYKGKKEFIIKENSKINKLGG